MTFTLRPVEGDPKHKTLACSTCGPVGRFLAGDTRGIQRAKFQHVCVAVLRPRGGDAA